MYLFIYIYRNTDIYIYMDIWYIGVLDGHIDLLAHKSQPQETPLMSSQKCWRLYPSLDKSPFYILQRYVGKYHQFN